MNVQMNVRIDEGLKAAGDKVFESMGLTPTQVIRLVWKYASQHQKEPAIVREALELSPEEFAQMERERALREIQDGSNLVARFREHFGLPAPDSLEDFDYDALREQALYDRLQERGLA